MILIVVSYSRAEKIKEQLRRKRKEMAMSYLRSRKQLEDLLSKRVRSLETVQSTLIQVESAAEDIEVRGLSYICNVLITF